MRRLSKYIIGASFLLPLLSCEDNRLEGMMDDKVYLLRTGLQPTQVFNFGEYDFDVFVIKSGLGTKDASVKITVTPEILETYNANNGTDYELLPDDCYLLKATTMDIPAKTPSVSFPILFNSTKIIALQQDGKKYILPLSLFALNDINVDPVMDEVLLDPIIQEPYIAFAEPGLTSANSITLEDPEEFSMKTSVKTNYENIWDLTFETEISQEALDAYNQAQGTSYKIFPLTAVSLNHGPWAMPAETSTLDISYTIMRKSLVDENGVYLFGEYVLPLKISSVSKYGIDPENGVRFIRYNYLPELLERAGWQVIDYNSCISQEEWYTWLNRTPDKILDGSTETFWGSKWDVPSPLPYYFVIDMKTAKTIFRLGITKPADTWRGNMKAGYFEISDDQQTWTKLTDWELESNDPRSPVFDVAPATGRYLRLTITEAFDYADNGVGAESGARMDMAELNVWGLEAE